MEKAEDIQKTQRFRRYWGDVNNREGNKGMGGHLQSEVREGSLEHRGAAGHWRDRQRDSPRRE